MDMNRAILINTVTSGRLVFWGVMGLILAAGVPVAAQDTLPSEVVKAVEPGDKVATMSELDAIIGQLAQARERQEREDKKKQYDVLLDIYGRAKAQLATADKFEAALVSFREAREKAPERLVATKADLDKIPPEAKVEEPVGDWSLEQIEQRITQLDAELAAAQKNAIESEAEAKKRTERRTEIPQASVRVKEQLENVRKELGAKPGAEVSAELAQAQRTLLLLTERALGKELESYQEEILSYDARGNLLQVRRDLAARQTAYYDKLVKLWREVREQRRKVKAEEDAARALQARREAAQSHPTIRKLAEENSRLAELRTGSRGLVALNAARAKEKEKIGRQLADLESDFASVKEKVKVAGLTDVIGVILLSKRNDLADVREHQRSIKARGTETAKARFEWIKYDERHAELADIEAAAESVLRDLGPQVSQEQREEISAESRKLLEARRDLLKSLVNEYETYMSQSADLDVMEQQLVVKTKEYANYINEHILWIKNTEVLDFTVFPAAGEALVWLLRPQGWWEVLSATGRDLKTSPLVYGMAGILLVLLIVSRHILKSRIVAISELINKKYADRFVHTLRVFMYSLILYSLRFDFPVFKRPECESFRSSASSIPADISFAFGKSFGRPV